MTATGRRLGVFTRLPSYLGAAAGLSTTAIPAGEPGGAVVVVPGSGDWWQGMLAARDQGAAAVIIADPQVLPRDYPDAGSWRGDIPVVVDRPRLRPDIVAGAVQARRGHRARAITVECAAPAAELEAVAGDGFGWVRSLGEGALALRAAGGATHGGIALMDVRSGGASLSATLAGTALGGGRGAGGLLQVLALGEVRTEVVVDQPAGSVRVETSTVDGILTAADQYESTARLALRRALDSCRSGLPTAELEDLLTDLALARRMLRGSRNRDV
ncbi:MAG TPA: hypothetical protein VJQ80_14415 [Arthrobacter sp.]|nr:hypothetical protein [Arthrobacter sp.]